jgi:hypothetical protein
MKRGFLFLLVMFHFSCTNTTKIPQGVISKEKMGVVLWDLILADRFSTLFLVKDSAKTNSHVENVKLYQRVFQIHKISKEEFNRSYKFYLSRPDIAKGIFDSIAVQAERQRANIYKPVAVQ